MNRKMPMPVIGSVAWWQWSYNELLNDALSHLKYGWSSDLNDSILMDPMIPVVCAGIACLLLLGVV